jgi:regulator of RNase E activity RraA
MPVITRYRTPAQGVGRWRVNGAQIPVQIRGALSPWISVAPDDAIVGDEDGVIAVPKELVARIAAKVEEWSKSETEARDEIAKGMPLLNALAKYGHL